jgi:hypothetical protein
MPVCRHSHADRVANFTQFLNRGERPAFVRRRNLGGPQLVHIVNADKFAAWQLRIQTGMVLPKKSDTYNAGLDRGVTHENGK